MKDQFDLEQEIMVCWGVVEDLQLLQEQVLDTNASQDDVANFVLGLTTIYEAKFQRLFNTFSTVMRAKWEEGKMKEEELAAIVAEFDAATKKSKKK